jgi:hypothetical protein
MNAASDVVKLLVASPFAAADWLAAKILATRGLILFSPQLLLTLIYFVHP